MAGRRRSTKIIRVLRRLAEQEPRKKTLLFMSIPL
jgi:hypothetical protein